VLNYINDSGNDSGNTYNIVKIDSDRMLLLNENQAQKVNKDDNPIGPIVNLT
jgi:hypothetical protein